ncbi:hypothetical protein SAMN05443574_1123 [Haloarcula vallismortis]|uniref:Uncharacterized protein n=1 Tax=Haloarcula vallismortis TaxID=28442 RepID=A0A1H2YAS5_HALVA|nr:hypothetical protein SAMN05443574_1123 [Haloarcula vallismortis]
MSNQRDAMTYNVMECTLLALNESGQTPTPVATERTTDYK